MSQGLVLTNLAVSIDEKQILKGVSLVVNPGETHAIMGPNGSGKSTLAYALAGHPSYTILSGSKVTLDGEDIISLSPDERAQKGLFLAFQYPVEVPGVSVQNFLRQAYQARFASEPRRLFKTVLEFRKHLQAIADELEISQAFLTRGLNEGFSGGEKKQLEILQLAVLEPKYVVLDETDSGLDIDAIKKVAKAVALLQKKLSLGVLVITHYQRILQYLKPDFVHVVVAGKIKQSGGPQLVEQLEKTGYAALKE
ncbi:MAG: Fe-S cluster assembly ATPase SufC [Candidatus Pacebacteria bacterium]|nr:Fe-S cluster assembly ATPase SufC [Candidatus Paceibacterota bacterium]PIR59614.1 MAG: Fe-S cluster assembly ATPase SufC [Candidatus Pacebacteria bacterium CG10_big_fil_rev_8_21_14_0_10_45_6]